MTRLLWVSGSWPLQVRASPASLLVTQHGKQVPGGCSLRHRGSCLTVILAKSAAATLGLGRRMWLYTCGPSWRTGCCRTTLQLVHFYVTAATPCRSSIIACMPYHTLPRSSTAAGADTLAFGAELHATLGLRLEHVSVWASSRRLCLLAALHTAAQRVQARLGQQQRMLLPRRQMVAQQVSFVWVPLD